MQIVQLRYLIVAAACGNFTEAARELYITQPALSQQIKALEEELKIKLFFRHPRNVTLTPAGEEFVEYAKRVVNDTDKTVANMKSYQKLEKGKVTIGCFWLFGYLNLAAPLRKFTQDHSSLDVQIKLGGSITLLELLRQRFLDAALVIAEPETLEDSELYYKLLHKDKMILMVHKSHHLAKKKVIVPEDLEKKHLIMPEENTPLYNEVQEMLRAHQVTPLRMCNSSHNEVNAQMVSNNLALSFSSLSVARAMNKGDYNMIPLDPPIERNVYFIVMKYRLSDPIIKELLNYYQATENKKNRTPKS
jgi:LysR family transcriptional activator of glutamate synthase operon